MAHMAAVLKVHQKDGPFEIDFRNGGPHPNQRKNQHDPA